MTTTEIAADAHGYGWGALIRHVPRSVTRMRRVVREMQALGIDERWRFIAIVVTAFVMAVDSGGFDLVAPDPAFDDWRAAYGAGAIAALQFVMFLVVGVIAPYAFAAMLYLMFRLTRRDASFADVRTGFVASGYPQVLISVFNLIVISAALLAGGDWNEPAVLVLNVSLGIAAALALGYPVVAVSAATDVPTLQVLGAAIRRLHDGLAALDRSGWTRGTCGLTRNV